ncbi:LexA family protein [Vibrio alfacsensis]|uniref:LexA family protein n=1 Tax=Vibrio alfacsensis TaxID=1074311 RepID=UPI001C801EC3|nr:translesion error-prone DNA polymerase V autoproteolytic subunit [Vibrio alfacsensis]
MNIITTKASAGITGFESPASDYQSSSLSLDSLLIQNPNATWIGQASGDSMQGLGIWDGDYLIIDRHVQVKHLDVVVCNLNGEFCCKQIDIHRRLLLSANERFQPVPISEHDEFTVEGVVIHSIHSFVSCNLGS